MSESEISSSSHPSPPAKKRKSDDDDSALINAKHVSSINETLTSFSAVKLIKTLNDDTHGKKITVLCQVEGNEADDGETAEQENDKNPKSQAIITLEKTNFDEGVLRSILSEGTKLTKQAHNDIYGWYHCFPNSQFNAIKASVIHPATPQHVNKYTSKPLWCFRETPEDFEEITLPWIKSEQLKIQWVYNILEHQKEQDRIVFEDEDKTNGFILLPDMKWDCVNNEELYLVAIVHRRDLHTLRSLNADHLPLLRNIRDKSLEIIKEKYGLSKGKLRAFLHYLPSYYHLHVHFTHVRLSHVGVQVERAHLLDDVIENLEANSEFYVKKSLTYVVFEETPLFKQLKVAGKLEPS